MQLTIDGRDWDRQTEKMAQILGGVRSRAFERAANRAVRKAARWLRTQLARAVAQDAGIPVTRFRQMRVSLRYDREDWSANLWLGLNPIPAHRTGKVKWTRRMRGARAGRRQFRGSFAWGPNPDKPVIFRRQGQARTPIEKVTVPVDEAAEEHARRLERRALQRFQTVLRQELNYEMAKRFREV